MAALSIHELILAVLAFAFAGIAMFLADAKALTDKKATTPTASVAAAASVATNMTLCTSRESSLSFIWDSVTPFQASTSSVEIAAFISLQASALRVSRSTQLWNATMHSAWDDLCPHSAEPSAKCRPYLYSDFRRAVLSTLDVTVSTEILGQSATCLENINSLRDLVTSFDDANSQSPGEDWWRLKWFPTVVEAFSCGYNDECYRPEERTMRRHENVFRVPYSYCEVTLPTDVACTYRNDIRTRKVWRLVHHYLNSRQKARESSTSWTDNAIGLYVPFYNTNIDHLPSDSTETYKDSVRATNSRILRYHREGKLRSSYTIYFGPATWHLWHVVAERIAEADNNDAVRRGGGAAVHEAHQRELARMHLTMVIAQGSVLPCPYCRSHFLNKVSNNDIFSVDSHSETGLYPLPYLYADDTGMLEGKLAAVTNGRQLRGFLISLHNAVSSSVQRSRSCAVTEIFDTEDNDGGEQVASGSGSGGSGSRPLFDCGVTTTLKKLRINAVVPWRAHNKVTWKGNLQELRVVHLLMHATNVGEEELEVDEHVVLATMGNWPYAYRWASRLGVPGSFRVVRSKTKGLIQKLQGKDSNALRWEHWTKRKTHDGVSDDEKLAAAEYSSTSGRIVEEEGQHVTVGNGTHTITVAEIRTVYASLTSMLASALVTKQYSLSDVPTFQGGDEKTFSKCAIAKRLRAMQRGEGGLLTLLGIDAPWDRDVPVCAGEI